LGGASGIIDPVRGCAGTRPATRQPAARVGTNLCAPLGHRSLCGPITVAEFPAPGLTRARVCRALVGAISIPEAAVAVTTCAR
jgi:hypothetical protein